VTSIISAALQRPIKRIGNDPSLISAVPIRECGEPLVEVPHEAGLWTAAAYHARGIRSAPDQVMVREGVLVRLREAASLLPTGTGLLLWDGLRTLGTQAEIVEDFRAGLPEEDRDATVAKYLALPPASEQEFRENPPPHTTGGAVDLTLCDQQGRPLDMGADFDEFDDIAWLAHFEDPASSEDPLADLYRERRRLLYWAMIGAGFSPYPWEYWHYEFGTPVAAVFHNSPFARYGAAAPWNLWIK
jgi:D-alanyl-D-alanine dipeptidase